LELGKGVYSAHTLGNRWLWGSFPVLFLRNMVILAGTGDVSDYRSRTSLKAILNRLSLFPLHFAKNKGSFVRSA
jgi:hypothetical protein